MFYSCHYGQMKSVDGGGLIPFGVAFYGGGQCRSGRQVTYDDDIRQHVTSVCVHLYLGDNLP